VAGVEEAKDELQEIIEFLREPQKFQKLGGRIPKGVLLMGPPGSGKTLLARAIAGEANVPFFSISGSDFVEMFVGVGASRVRDLFEQGKKNAPCIIFIDEIDAVGRHRGAGLGGGHDEREQTLNALLVEMDGFESNDGVILIAATNRPDVLDPALLRPGRFDRRVVVSRPDVRGREGILQVHTRKIPLAEDVDISVLARSTPGFSGADLANLVNEAALAAARQNQKFVSMKDFESSKDKVLMGAERRSLIITDEEKKVTAFHEAGHALLAALVPQSDPLHKVTIIPRGLALGLTQQLPSEERHNWSKEQLEARIAVCMGGRIAEETTFGQITTGAQNDIEQATEMARKMVCEWGMSDALGPLTYGKKEEAIFLGKEYSEATALKIDAEIKRIVTEQYERATRLLTENRPTLVRVAEALLEHEVLDAPQLKQLIAGEPLELKPAPKAAPAPAREVRAEEGGRPAGILPPPVADPRPTS
jgi:cell division protease FtsH